jgi:hypothetical protein
MNPYVLAPNNALRHISDNGGESYNTCHCEFLPVHFPNILVCFRFAPFMLSSPLARLDVSRVFPTFPYICRSSWHARMSSSPVTSNLASSTTLYNLAYLPFSVLPVRVLSHPLRPILFSHRALPLEVSQFLFYFILFYFIFSIYFLCPMAHTNCSERLSELAPLGIALFLPFLHLHGI